MSRSVYIASPEGNSGKSSVALGLVELLSRRVGRVGIYRPVIDSMGVIDPVAELLVGHPGVVQAYEDAIGVTYTELHADPAGSLSRIVDKFGLLSAKFDAIVVVGSDYTDVTTGNEWASNAQIAANIGSPVVLVVHGRGRNPQDIAAAVDLARAELVGWHAHPVAAIANRVKPEDLIEVRALLGAGCCKVEVRDSGVGLGNAAGGLGTGLATLRERLHLAFGERGRLQLLSLLPHGVLASIEFPTEPAKP